MKLCIVLIKPLRMDGAEIYLCIKWKADYIEEKENL